MTHYAPFTMHPNAVAQTAPLFAGLGVRGAAACVSFLQIAAAAWRYWTNLQVGTTAAMIAAAQHNADAAAVAAGLGWTRAFAGEASC